MLDNDNYDIIVSIRSKIQQEIPTISWLKEQLGDEIIDPEIKMLCNFRHLFLEQLDTFNVDNRLFKIPPYQEGEDPAMMTKLNIHTCWSYHNKIWQYETSPYYVNYLSDEIIQIPIAHTDTVQNQTL